MNFFNRSNQKAMAYEEFRTAFDDEVLETANLRSAVGRPKAVLLGERSQITRSLGIHIAKLLVANLTEKGFVIGPGPSGKNFYDEYQLADWAKDRITALAQVNKSATADNPFSLVKKICGRLLCISQRRPGVRESVYINRDCATPAELLLWIANVENVAQHQNRIGYKAATDVREVLAYLQDDQSLIEGEAAYYAAIRDSRKPK